LQDWNEKKNPQTPRNRTRLFLSNLSVKEKSRSTQGIRGHWRIKNGIHQGHASACQEDRDRH
jgi:predicted transposase YbfD/YdcC